MNRKNLRWNILILILLNRCSSSCFYKTYSSFSYLPNKEFDKISDFFSMLNQKLIIFKNELFFCKKNIFFYSLWPTSPPPQIKKNTHLHTLHFLRGCNRKHEYFFGLKDMIYFRLLRLKKVISPVSRGSVLWKNIQILDTRHTLKTHCHFDMIR